MSESLETTSVEASSLPEFSDNKLAFQEIAHLEDLKNARNFHVSSDGKHIAYASNSDQILVRSLDDFSIVYSIPNSWGSAPQLHLSNDKRTLGVSTGPNITLVNLETQETILTYRYSTLFLKFEVTDDKKYVLLNERKTASLVNLETQTVVHVFEGSSRDLSLSAGHQYILSKGDNHSKVWKIDTQEEVLSYDYKVDIAQFVKGDRHLVHTSSNHPVTVVDLETRQEVFSRAIYNPSGLAANDEYLAIIDGSGYSVFNLNTWDEIATNHPDTKLVFYSPAALSRDGRYLVISLSDGTAGVFDLSNNISFRSYPLDPSGLVARSIRINDDGAINVYFYDNQETHKLLSYNLNNIN